MGVELYFYVIPMNSYMKLIKPKLIQYYGPVCQQKILRQERRKQEYGIIMQHCQKVEKKEAPLEKFFKSSKSGKYKGSQNGDLYVQIKDLLKKQSIYWTIDRDPNFFLIYDDFMSYLDIFGAHNVRVSHMNQVENFIQYIQVVREVYQGESNKLRLAQQYDGYQDAEVIYKHLLQNMKKSKKETVLVQRDVF